MCQLSFKINKLGAIKLNYNRRILKLILMDKQKTPPDVTGQVSSTRRTIIETIKQMPFTCLNCDEKVVRLRDLARLGCHCLRPFYHFHCLAALPINLCMKCNKRAHTLRGIKAIWDSFTHDEWKNAFNLNNLTTDTRPYLIELMDSMFLDWSENVYGQGLTSGLITEMPQNSLNFLICDYWKVFNLIEDSTDSSERKSDQLTNKFLSACDKITDFSTTEEKCKSVCDKITDFSTTEEKCNLILDRLEDALRIYPLEDRVILGSKQGIRRIKKDPTIQNHGDFLQRLYISSQGIINPQLLSWIKEDLIRNQSIFFTGPLVFDILYGAFLPESKDSKKLIIQILGLDDGSIRSLIAGILEKIFEGFTYTCDITDNVSCQNSETIEGRKCYVNNLGQNRLKLSIEGLSQQIEIHVFRSNDIRKIMISTKAGSVPYYGDGLIASPSGLWTTLRWLYATREQIVVSEGNYKIPKNIKTQNNGNNLKQIIDIECIKHGFLLCTDLSRLRRVFADPYTDYEDLDDDIEEMFIPDSCMRITIDNLWHYMQKPSLSIQESPELCTTEVELPFFFEESCSDNPTDDSININANTGISTNASTLSGNNDANENISMSMSMSNGSRLSQNDLGNLWSNNPHRNDELVANLVRRITYNKKSNILDSLPNPYLPQRRF